MLTTLLHRLVAQPRVYELVQVLAGLPVVHRRLARQLARLPAPAVVLDLGGGTGISRPLLPRRCTYICLDMDPQKLRGFTRAHPADPALLADATRLPIRDDSIDLVLCKSVSHHLAAVEWERLVAESQRVLKPGGAFVLVDAVWQPRRRAGLLLWRFDRGAHPHPARALRATLARHYQLRHWEHFAVYHEYVLGIGVKGRTQETAVPATMDHRR